MDVFVHIPKASGSTVRAILSRQYGIERILYFEPGSARWDNRSTQREFLEHQLQRRHIDLITGHHPFGVHTALNVPCRSFAIVRDPLHRALSEYFYAYSYTHHRYREEIVSGRLSVEQFLSDPAFGLWGAQAGMLAGRWESPGGPSEAALENTRWCFDAVGTVERFEKSLLYIAKALGWKPPIFVKKNVTRLDPDVELARRRAEEAARQQRDGPFAAEYGLYARLNSLLSERIAAEGEPFADALLAYREMQAEIADATTEEIHELYEFRENDCLPLFARRLVDGGAYRAVEEYLGSGPPARVARRNYVGFIDRIDDKIIGGWAADLWRTDPIEVTITRHGHAIMSVSCDRERIDVVRDGYPRTNVGFRADFPEGIENPNEYDVFFERTALKLWRSSSLG